MSGPQPSELRCFNENSPRPPVPGEERGSYLGRCHSSSPDPARSSCDAADAYGEPEGRCDRAVVMEEPRISTSEKQLPSASQQQPPQLACLQWTRSLHALLEDPKGLELFEQYLQQEGHLYALWFWFACEGLKEEHDPNKLTAIIKVLIRRFFQRPQLALPEDVRKEMTRRFREGRLADKGMFDLAQNEVEKIIKDTNYPNFLHSEVYLQYVRYCQSTEKQQQQHQQQQQQPANNKPLSHVEDSSPEEPSLSCAANLLPTVLEDNELTIQQQQRQQQQELQHHRVSEAANTQTSAKGEMRLTKDMLMATQQLRALDVRPKPEAYAGHYLQPGASPYHASVPTRPRAQYSSYNPVSRQDSELQSLSSDARTESDNLSLTDASLSGGESMGKRNTRKQHIRHMQQMKRSAMINRDPEGIIPRTQRIAKEQTQPMKPESFARLLIEKLEKVKRDREVDETLVHKLQQVEPSSHHGDNAHEGSMGSLHFTDALREKLQLEEDSDQAILDQHVSRVWSDLTPSRSPKLASPRPRSPDKPGAPHQTYSSHQQQSGAMARQAMLYRSQRKEKDVFSTFSGDSGNVHDFTEAASCSSLSSHLPKSKSVPSDYADSLHKQDLYLQGQDQRYNRKLEAQRSSATKKSMTELTDSGVSMVSEDSRMMHWRGMKDVDVVTAGGKAIDAGASSVSTKQNRKKLSSNLPQQPFVGDPGMPLLPQPHTDSQLEEAKRRLEYEQSRSRQRYAGSVKQQQQQLQQQEYDMVPPPQSNQSTLRRGRQESSTDFTTVVFSFCDEKVPYRTKIAGYNVTLKQFKDVLPKKGSYRYFFKTECEDLDMKVIQEEITDDSEVLPLWEGKVMAQVKALE